MGWKVLRLKDETSMYKSDYILILAVIIFLVWYFVNHFPGF